jgi:undecaprenyl-diphosphatase
MSPLLKAAFLGIVQGVTEFLPVSSTAHLLIGARLVGFDDPGGVFTVMIQLGSILAIVWLYRAKITEVITTLPSSREAQRFVLTVFLAFIPAAVAGALFAGFVKRVLYTTLVVLAVAFIVGGIVMLVAERLRPIPDVQRPDRVSPGRGFLIGLWQMLALIPGVSRSGATMVGGMLTAVDRPAAAEFSFFLAIPTMGAAFAHDLWEARHQLSGARTAEIAVGFVMAFIASAIVVEPFVAFIRRAGFAPFAWYRIVLGGAILGALGARWI